MNQRAQCFRSLRYIVGRRQVGRRCDVVARRSHDHYDAPADSRRRLIGRRAAGTCPLRAVAAAANNAYANRSHFSSARRQSSLDGGALLDRQRGRSHDSTRVDLFIINL